MATTKQIGDFTGSVKFYNAENIEVSPQKIIAMSISSSDETIATVSINPADAKITGNAATAGSVTLILTATNDKGAGLSAVLNITFVTLLDTTAVTAVIQID